MESVYVNFDAIDSSNLALIKDYNSVVEQAERLKQIVDSVDVSWVDKIVSSSEKYKDYTLLMINDIIMNLDELKNLMTNVGIAMEEYTNNETTGETNINSVSF